MTLQKISANALLENQRLINHKMKVTQDSRRLMSGKRRGEEHKSSYDDIKRRKLELIGSKNIYTTSKSIARSLGEISGLINGFTDLSLTQVLYEQKLSCNKSPNWMKNKEDEAVTTWTTRSWDNNFMCTESVRCPTPSLRSPTSSSSCPTCKRCARFQYLKESVSQSLGSRI